MSNPRLKTIVRTRFRLASAKSVEKQSRDVLAQYLKLAKGIDETSGKRPVTVPSMLGVDEDMRGWSFFSLLQHNTLVNRAISSNIRRLALGEPPPETPFDVKNDVMPSPDCGIEQVELFEKSVTDHLAMIAGLPGLRGTQQTDHPIFGSFDAHMWNCMFAFHLKIHLKQADLIAARS
ncbi:MAG: DinB family protein [Verrucomicrobia bacterium]|jgi:hypothetical protein|nr:DinB family protein [Verrucomicrobiota bacterium]|tara:strand:+ start:8961 stop:9491 length:531 start_codon:yes stop_codon:yes gene_type:complete